MNILSDKILFFGLTEGIKTGLLTILLTFILDLLCYEYVLKINNNLYFQAIIKNILNITIIGPITYSIAYKYMCFHGIYNIFQQILCIFGILLIQSILYYLAHIIMHIPKFYWMHKFHHKFNTYIIPMSANAVSLSEFFFAYMIPILSGILLFKPDYLSLKISIFIISLNNLFIHTHVLKNISNYLPNIFVSTDNHFDHHNKLTTHYAAPTLNWDNIVKYFKKIDNVTIINEIKNGIKLE